jgi:hypothetical protein
MKAFRIALTLVFLSMGLAGPAHADLESFLRRVDAQAREDLGRFSVKLSTQFGIPVPKVDEIIKRVPAPADAFMVLQLGQMTGKPPDSVVRTYESNRGRGWGAVAKELGIKPGSPEFHALKRGDLSFTGVPAGGVHSAPGKGKGRAKKN